MEDNLMGTFYEKITLGNNTDRILADRGHMKKEQVRTIEVEAMPDTGAWTLIINENIRQQLGLNVIGTVESSFADGSTTMNDLTEAVEICWKDRRTSQEAVVVPNATDILLGAIPLEALDLYVDPVNQKLVGIHGDKPLYLTK